MLIGANATVLGNITIGKGAQIAAGSLVLKAVTPHTMVAGSPAREVGKVGDDDDGPRLSGNGSDLVLRMAQA